MKSKIYTKKAGSNNKKNNNNNKYSKTKVHTHSLHKNDNKNTINILSYNVSWESMTGKVSNWALCSNNTNIKSPKHYSVCVNNIANVINDLPETLDFITLQEATNYEKLIEQSPLLKKMKYEKHKSELDEIVTFWLPKYKLLYSIKGKFEEGRAWLATIFTNGISQSRICLINLHMGHYDHHKEYLHLETLIFQIKEHIMKNEVSKKKSMKSMNGMIRYIISGDFNFDIKELGSMNKKEGIININGTRFYYNPKNVLTCCINRRRHYDHVIDSETTPIDITIPKVNYMASDHKPIIVKLLN